MVKHFVLGQKVLETRATSMGYLLVGNHVWARPSLIVTLGESSRGVPTYCGRIVHGWVPDIQIHFIVRERERAAKDM